MKLAALSEMERTVFNLIVEAMSKKERCDYGHHVASTLEINLTAETITCAQSMKRKGWLTSAPTFDEEAPVILSRDAWSLISLEEWERVSEEVREQDSGDQFGSW